MNDSLPLRARLMLVGFGALLVTFFLFYLCAP
jgi:hypothetical protein